MLQKIFVVFVLVVSFVIATPAMAAPSVEFSALTPVMDWWMGWVEWMGLGPATSPASQEVSAIAGQSDGDGDAGSGLDPIGDPSQLPNSYGVESWEIEELLQSPALLDSPEIVK